MMRICKKNKQKIKLEIENSSLKKLEVFESVEGKYNTFGFSVMYTRVPGGIIRTITNAAGMDQILIPLPNTFFC